jgi:hypothetical protein
MCYNDGSGVPVRPDVCPAAHEPYFDCNKDDYFHTNPPAGSYLATRWNPARSSFLDGPGTLALAVPQHSRAVSLTAVTRRLVLRGRVVTLDGYGNCASNVPVRLQRRSGTSWTTILSRRTRATGAFGLQLPRRTGSYRAFAPRTTVAGNHRCLAAASFSVRLRVG